MARRETKNKTNILDGDDATITAQVEAGKSKFTGFELVGKTLGIVGLCKIGVLSLMLVLIGG